MSMVICQECDHLIDSDEDCDCFIGETVLCQWCRDANEIDDDPDSAEVQIERRVDFLVRELDEFMAMASHAETVDLIAAEERAIGQALTRCQLILSFLVARQTPKLKMVQNNG